MEHKRKETSAFNFVQFSKALATTSFPLDTSHCAFVFQKEENHSYILSFDAALVSFGREIISLSPPEQQSLLFFGMQ